MPATAAPPPTRRLRPWPRRRAAATPAASGGEGLAVSLPEPLGLALELAAGGEDVTAAGGAHRGGIAGPIDDIGELLDPSRRRALVGAARPGVERDQVDLGRDVGEQADQLA